MVLFKITTDKEQFKKLNIGTDQHMNMFLEQDLVATIVGNFGKDVAEILRQKDTDSSYVVARKNHDNLFSNNDWGFGPIKGQYNCFYVMKYE